MLVRLPPSSSPTHRGCLWVSCIALNDPAPSPAMALPSFSQAGGVPAYDHDPSTHNQQHYGPPTSPHCLRSKERTSPGPISIIWARGPDPLVQDVCIGQQPAAGGLGLHTPHLFLPSVFVVWKGTSSRPVPTTTTPPASRRTIHEFLPGPGVPGCTPAVQVCLDVLSLGHVSSILAPCIHLFSSPFGPRRMMPHLF